MMAIKSKDEMPKNFIDLTGPQGNAFVLLGMAKSLCKQLKWDYKPIVDEMKSGNYENLVDVFEREFGDYVNIYR